MIFDNIFINWRLKRKIPANQKNGGKFRYAPNGIDKIFVDIDNEVKLYNSARKKLKEKEELDKKAI